MYEGVFRAPRAAGRDRIRAGRIRGLERQRNSESNAAGGAFDPRKEFESSVSHWRPTGVTFALESILQKGRWKGREPASWGSRRETTPAAWKEVTEPELRQGHENRKGQTAPEDVAEAESASPSYRPDVESEEYRMSPKAPASRMEGQAIPSAETGN